MSKVLNCLSVSFDWVRCGGRVVVVVVIWVVFCCGCWVVMCLVCMCGLLVVV